MTTVPSATTPAATAPAATGASTAAGAMQDLSGNFDTFLSLLTTQLQNQDPLSPMDSNQFTQELVQFSGVEQQINTNQDLEKLITLQQGSSNNNALGYLGKSITITNGSAALQNGQADWSYALGGAAAATVLSVTDANGKVVFTQPGDTSPGQHDFSWDGTDNNGAQLPDGAYTLTASAQAADGSNITTAVASKGLVNEVNFTGSEPLLMVGSMAVPVSAVSAIDSN